MVTNAEGPEEEPTPAEKREELARIVIGGHPQAAIRRIALYTLLFLSLGAAFFVPPMLAAALVLTSLLAMTDQLA